MNGNNLRRIFADVVSIDAWHTPFDGKTGIAALHVDAVFSTARLGGEDTSPIRFRLSLKRAEIVAIAHRTEPIDILRESVSRDQTISSVKLTNSQSTSSNIEANAKIKLNTSSPIVAAIQADTGLGMKSTNTFSSTIDKQSPLVLATQSQTADGYYRWELRPALGYALLGRSWDAAAEPRFKFKDKRTKSTHLKGTIRLEVRCKREDLLIEDIIVKDEPLLARLRSASSLRNKMAAVEAYLRNALTDQNLYFTNLDDPFGDICLADIMIDEVGS